MNGNSPFVVPVDFGMVAASLLCLAPTIWIILLIRRQFSDYRKRNQLPFKELKRRPAGEYLRIKLEELNDQISDQVFLMLGMPVLLPFTIYVLKIHNPFAWLLAIMASAAWTLVFRKKLTKLLETRRNYRLGFDGERYVGEELSRLIALGYEIYHDVPFDSFNLDHVLVGKHGVFVVETKTRSKPVFKSGKKKYEVEFDGEFLHWPWGSEDKDINQVRMNAKTLASWLFSAIAEPVEVSAILTFPGWEVVRKGHCNDVNILEPEEIIKACETKKVKFNEQTIKRICHQLNQRCRVVIN